MIWDGWLQSHRWDPAAWAPVNNDESHELWDRFYDAFAFRPSMQDMPGIDEPTPSTTYSLTYDDAARAEPVWVTHTILDALRRVTDPDASVLVMNWQHQTYRCRPHRIADGPVSDQAWPTGIHPEGDYFIWLAEDFRFGTFGHPWEPSLCVFGEELLAAVAECGDESLGRVLRRDGRAVGS